MTCLRADRKCRAKDLGRSRAKRGLMSCSPFLLMNVGWRHYPNENDLHHQGKKVFYPFLFLSIELMKLNRSFAAENIHSTDSVCRTCHLFSPSAKRSEKELRHVGVLPGDAGVYSEQPPKISSCPSCSHFQLPFLGRREAVAGLSGAMPEGSLADELLAKDINMYL